MQHLHFKLFSLENRGWENGQISNIRYSLFFDQIKRRFSLIDSFQNFSKSLHLIVFTDINDFPENRGKPDFKL